MRHGLVGALAIGLLAAGLAGGRPSAQSSPTIAQLDRYLHGDFDGVTAALAALTDFGDVLDALKRDGPAWIKTGPAAERARRQLAAATFALEAARAAEHTDWKWVQRVSLNLGRPPAGFLPQSSRAADALWWKPPALLLEWGCALMRTESRPMAIERIWHLAAVAVAQRWSDYEFLIGSPWEERGDPGAEIEHLAHVLKQLPDEPRFALAQAIAIEWRTWPTAIRHPRTATRNLPDAMRAFELLTKDPVVGAEAWLRLGALRLRGRNLNGALETFDDVERLTRDGYLVYLARYFRGQARERQNRPAEAEQAYRGALATVPHAMSATMALAALLVKADRRADASALVEASLAARPQPGDPWRTYATADDRFWPDLISRLRAEILR